MEAWETALQFLLIDNRAQALADAHPFTKNGLCARCGTPDCAAATLAAQALATLAYRRRAKAHGR